MCINCYVLPSNSCSYVCHQYITFVIKKLQDNNKKDYVHYFHCFKFCKNSNSLRNCEKHKEISISTSQDINGLFNISITSLWAKIQFID